MRTRGAVITKAPGVYEVIDIDLDPQSRPKTHLFDVQISARKRQLLTPRNCLPLAQPQRVAQEVGEANAHFARAVRGRGGEGRDGVETIEQEVRIDLRFERAQFRVACVQRRLTGRLEG